MRVMKVRLINHRKVREENQAEEEQKDQQLE